jgi:hypothetical protein
MQGRSTVGIRDSSVSVWLLRECQCQDAPDLVVCQMAAPDRDGPAAPIGGMTWTVLRLKVRRWTTS